MSQENGNKRYEETELYRIRHSAAHVMAEAVLERYPQAKLAIGPPIEDGFYYDFDLGRDGEGKPRTFSPEDLQAIEKRLKALLKKDARFRQETMEIEEALEYFSDQPYKVELIEELAAGKVDEMGQPISEPLEEVGIYRHREFVDLCRGPHVESTGKIKANAVKVLRSSGAYWRGDENRPQLQRIYGTAWHNKEELADYLQRMEEARERDHRRLGKQMELFHLDETAPGMPYWLPKGLKVLHGLFDFWREEHERHGFQEIASPLVNDVSLWKTSGHWEHFRDEMFLIPVDEHRTYALKPMNCPNAMIVFGLKTRSYRDLPLRLSDTDVLHRNERSGTLHGLLRVQHIQQDDAHIFVSEDQIEQEFESALDLIDRFYAIFGFAYRLRLSTRPEDFMGDLETWNEAEATLRRILDRRIGPGNYFVDEGDGAFYGPKIDIDISDALGRLWQMGTVQLDFQLPRRFDLKYTDSTGQERTPVVIHRVVYGSFERFIGILIEHFNGAFPLWLAPVQAVLIPITDRHLPYCRRVAAGLEEAGLRVQVDDSGNRMSAKIREAQLQKVPYMLVVGDREVDDETVSVRTREEEDRGALPVNHFRERALDLVASRSLAL